MKKHFIKPNYNMFHILSLIKDEFIINLNNILLITYYLKKRIEKQKIPINLKNILKTLLPLLIKYK